MCKKAGGLVLVMWLIFLRQGVTSYTKLSCVDVVPSITNISFVAYHSNVRKMVYDLVGIPLDMGRIGNLYSSKYC